MIRPRLWLALGLLACGREGPQNPTIAAPLGPPLTHLAKAESLATHDQLDSASAAFQAVVVEARAKADTLAEAQALTWLGRIAWQQGNYEAARRDSEAALALKQAAGLSAELFSSYNVLGLLAWNQGRLTAAESLFDAASRAAAAQGNGLDVGKASGNLGLVKVELGDYPGARAKIEAMRTAGRADDDARVEGNALANLAMLDIREGDPRAAIPRLLEASQAYARINYVQGEANRLGQMATAWRDLGDFQAAFAAADSALGLAKFLGSRQEEAAELEVIATLHGETGDLSAALRRLKQAQAINAALGLEVEDGTDQRRVAEIRLEMGERTQAIQGGSAALDIHVRVGAQPERLSDLLFLAQADSANSSRWLDQATRLADSLGGGRAHRDVALVETQAAVARHDWVRALEAIEPIARRASSLGPFERWQVADLEGRVLRGAGQLARAEAAARRSVAAVERTRGSLGTSWSRARLVASRTASYVNLVEILLLRGRTADAFKVADAARGHALLERLGDLDAATTPSTTLLAMLAARERSLRRIDEVEEQLAALGDEASSEVAATRIRLRTRLSALQADYAESALRVDRPTSARDILGGSAVDVGDLQKALTPGEAVIEYLVGADQTHLFLVTSGRVEHETIPVSATELASRVRVARDLTGSPGAGGVVIPVLDMLRRQLLRPALDKGWLTGTDHLIVIPHATLGYLPFAALFDRKRGRYLVQDMAVSTAPSAAALLAIRRLPERRAADAPLTALAPFPEQLPGSAIEATRAVALRPTSRGFVGASATEAEARRAAEAGRTLLVSTHGELNPDNPLFSRIRLRATDRDDGRLEVHEILGLRIEGSLIYLSGCETGLSGTAVLSRGDAFVALGQAFLFGGARGVVATLWRTSDAGSVPLVESFFRHLGESGPVQALAQAQREMIASRNYSDPYYWAGHVLSGSPR